MTKTVYLASAVNFVLLAFLARGAQGQSAVSGSVISSTSQTVQGRVSVAGSHPRPKPLPVFKNRAFCGPTVLNETLLVGDGGGLRNTVILLRPMDRKVETQPGAITLDNKNCAFAPHVQVATVGSDLLLKNSDPILHTVHARVGRDTLFNVGLPRWRLVSKRLDRLGVMRIDCDVLHTWMSAAIVVTGTPYFAVTEAEGNFKIQGLPPGMFEMEIWHERLGSKMMRLAVAEKSTRVIDVVYSVK